MSAGLFVRLVEARAHAALDTSRPEVELAHAMRQLLTVLGLAQLSGLLFASRVTLSDAAAAVVERLALGHGQLVAVHAADVCVRALAIAVAAADLETARANVLRQALFMGPFTEDPRTELVGRLRAIEGPDGDPRLNTRDLRGPCAGIAHMAARLGLCGEVDPAPATHGQPGVSADIRRVPTTRPAPPDDEAPTAREGDADAR